MKPPKLMRKLFVFLLCLCCQLLSAQVPQVGNTMEFAGMELRLTDQARRDIQSSVDALYRSEKFFGIMLERVDLYMPVIESILVEQGVPEDFKYLVIQESALIPDAVSSSNAVGFWQFKEASATELSMRVDRQVDERMNIVSATQGAAQYLLRSNAEFDNWLYSLLSYMVGQGGTSRSVDKRFYGSRKMTIDKDTHWYIKKYLSHKVAFENAIGKNRRDILLYQYTNTANKSLRHIAREFDADEEQLEAYNKWLKTNSIPDDKVYTVIVPLNISESKDLFAEQTENKHKKAKEEPTENRVYGQKQQAPEEIIATPDKLLIVELNKLKGVVARAGDHAEKLAQLGDISERRFRNINDLEDGDKILAGQFYYLEKKRSRARVYEHVLQPGESLWSVSQKYGIRLRKLIRKNRLERGEQPKPGRVLWLRFIRPRNEPVEHREVKPVKENLYTSRKTPVSVAPQQPGKTSLSAKAVLEDIPPPEVKEEENSREGNPKHELEAKPEQKNEIGQPKPAFQKEEQEINAPKLLYPAENLPQKQKQVAEEQAKAKEIARDTIQEKQPERKILTENKENNSKLSTPDASAKQKASASDSFKVEEPVTFIGEKEAVPTNKAAASLHQVEAGETLYSLSRRYGITVKELIFWNELPESPVLSIGQLLHVSAPENGGDLNTAPPLINEQEDQKLETEKEIAENKQQEESFRYHTVSAGESMYRVARMYNVTIKDIMSWNQKETFDIKEGERLVVGIEQK